MRSSFLTCYQLVSSVHRFGDILCEITHILLFTYHQYGKSLNTAWVTSNGTCDHPLRRESALTAASPNHGYTLSPRRPERNCASSVLPHLGPRKPRLSSVRTPIPTFPRWTECYQADDRGSHILAEDMHADNLFQTSLIKTRRRSVPKMAKSTPRWRISLTSSPNPPLDTFFSAIL